MGKSLDFYELAIFANTPSKFTDDTANEGSYETRRFLLFSFRFLWDYGLMLRRWNQNLSFDCLIGKLIEKKALSEQDNKCFLLLRFNPVLSTGVCKSLN